MLQRIGLAQALLNEPKLVFLDEPTSGLDPVGRRLVRDIIRDLKSQGATVFLNSHLLSEVEITCDRVAFIKNGQVIRLAALQTLVDGQTTVELRVGNLTPSIVAGLAQWGQDVRADGNRVHLSVSDEESLPQPGALDCRARRRALLDDAAKAFTGRLVLAGGRHRWRPVKC